MDYLVTESQLKILVENTSESYVFKSEYKPENKSVLASYYLLDENDKTYKVLNPIEIENKNQVWADGKLVYYIKMPVIILPKSQVYKLGPESNHEGYFKFQIPYWLFKKQEDLKIQKLNQTKKFSAKNDSDFVKSYDIYDYRTAFESIGTDMTKWSNMFELWKKHDDIKKQKEAGTYVEPEKPYVNLSRGFLGIGDSHWSGD